VAQAALVAASRRAEDESWVQHGAQAPSIEVIREEQEESYAAPANTPAVSQHNRQATEVGHRGRAQVDAESDAAFTGAKPGCRAPGEQGRGSGWPRCQGRGLVLRG
jgi:hypothetical protein